MPNFSPEKLFRRPGDSFVGIDLGISSVKMVQLKKDKGQVVLESYGELSTGPYGGSDIGQAVALSAPKMAELLKDLMTEANITAKVGAMSIPLRSSLLVNIEIPEAVESKLSEIISIEARKYVPVPVSEVVLDWWIVPKREQEIPRPIMTIKADQPPVDKVESKVKTKKIEVMMAAIHKDVIKQFQNIGKLIEKAPEFLEIETFSAIRACLKNETDAVAFLDIGAGNSKVAIIDYGIVRLSHTINKGSQDVTVAIAKSLGLPFVKAEEIKRKVGLSGKVRAEDDLSKVANPIMEYIFNEANRVIVNYQNKYRRVVSKVVLIGGGSQLLGLPEIGRRVVSVPLEIGAPFDKTKAPAFLADILKEAGPSFAVAIGVALRGLETL